MNKIKVHWIKIIVLLQNSTKFSKHSRLTCFNGLESLNYTLFVKQNLRQNIQHIAYNNGHKVIRPGFVH